MPEARAAGRRAEVGRVDGDDRPEAARRVVDEVQAFMRVEIGEAPGRGHVVGKSALLPEKMGRPTGLEPATLGTTNRCSNQLSYDRHRALAGSFPGRARSLGLAAFEGKQGPALDGQCDDREIRLPEHAGARLRPLGGAGPPGAGDARARWSSPRPPTRPPTAPSRRQHSPTRRRRSPRSSGRSTSFCAYERINYLMLMMVDPHVHFHVIPRYSGEPRMGRARLSRCRLAGTARPASRRSKLEPRANRRRCAMH